MNYAVIYWSGTGNTKSMAEAITEGIKSTGKNADLFDVSDAGNLDISEYDGIALGCSSMGSENLEEGEFQPFFDGIKVSLSGKDAVLFGSYGWGEGEWMRTWQEECEGLGMRIKAEPLIIHETPDDEGLNKCREFGKALV